MRRRDQRVEAAGHKRDCGEVVWRQMGQSMSQDFWEAISAEPSDMPREGELPFGSFATGELLSPALRLFFTTSNTGPSCFLSGVGDSAFSYSAMRLTGGGLGFFNPELSSASSSPRAQVPDGTSPAASAVPACAPAALPERSGSKRSEDSGPCWEETGAASVATDWMDALVRTSESSECIKSRGKDVGKDGTEPDSLVQSRRYGKSRS